jgi:D-alanine-D-alanine ligase-like ATP-grasp enzyme
MEELTKLLVRGSGLEMLGVDFLVEENGKLVVIDVNFFTGIKTDEFAGYFRELIVDRLRSILSVN